ncbi:hypothetical protein [Halomonas sp. A11-A]|uniref:hypothetical protein n=1 Tax=Halomonas sp. A11-A TaxID=2183985 RepID=UPI000D70CB37|nr:hypothetical protein [Halomonas sp. A11-A]PWV74536.1 hypothetical protein DER72_1125 [Halomonas sp. A11-A]
MSDVTLPRREGQAPTRGWHRWGLSLLVVLLLLVLFEGGHRWLESRSQAPLFRVIVAGESLTLDAQAHADFTRDLATLTGEAQARLAARMTPWWETRLEAAFDPLAAAVPGYLDWYFSAPGSYQRLAVALVGDLDGWLDEQLHERLVVPSGLEAALVQLQADYPERLAREQQAMAEGLAATLHERYAPRQVAAEPGEGESPALDLDAVLQHALDEGLDRSRWSAAAVGGSGVGLVAGRALAGRLGAGAAVQGSRMALRSLALRLGTGAALPGQRRGGGGSHLANRPGGRGGGHADHGRDPGRHRRQRIRLAQGAGGTLSPGHGGAAAGGPRRGPCGSGPEPRGRHRCHGPRHGGAGESRSFAGWCDGRGGQRGDARGLPYPWQVGRNGPRMPTVSRQGRDTLDVREPDALTHAR